MHQSPLPFDPMRRGLYTPADLLAGFDPAEPESLAEALDYRIFRYWVAQGRYKPNYFDGMMQSLHDNAISQSLAALVGGRKVVAVMGGHAVGRDSPAYGAVATLARKLAGAGFLVVSGGGPGIMEAVHAGALHLRESDRSFAQALADLARVPSFPAEAGLLVSRDGAVDRAVLHAIAAWLAPALEVLGRVDDPGRSLGVPTWRYGHEPTSVFATDIAKYFENSVREDGLLSVASHGVVYAEGGPGTVQEIFQDAVFNIYADEDRRPSPMIFFGRAHWDRMAVMPVLRELFGPAGFGRYVSVTDDVDDVVGLVGHFEPDAIRPLISESLTGRALSTPALRGAGSPPAGDIS